VVTAQEPAIQMLFMRQVDVQQQRHLKPVTAKKFVL